MEEIAFSDWPGQPVDAGGHAWLPAYGFQTPAALLQRDDFLGHPDAEYFLHGSSTPCLYLETIHEETSDDLRSDSDISDVRASPLGWLATDSETDSVICMDATNSTDCEESDRELACPSKRRRQEPPLDDECRSLSRSSSLLQFESLEKQCQETSSSYSQLSLRPASDSDSGGSASTLAPSKSCGNLRAWRSSDDLPKPKSKASSENLSEDSGYSAPKSFDAYDYCEAGGKIGGRFGASCQNLHLVVEWVNLEQEECRAKYKSASASEPSLRRGAHSSAGDDFKSVSSVPKNLDLLAGAADEPKRASVASQNLDLADLSRPDMAQFKREGSYEQAMRNRVDLSDDETSLCYKKRLPRTTIVDFDKKVLSAISESIHSVNSGSIADAHLSDIYGTPPPMAASSRRNVASTPNLVMNLQEQERFMEMMIEEERRRSVQDLPRGMPRKSSLVNHSTSTSCVSDGEDKTINFEAGSTKEVHFSPVVSEVNWESSSPSPSPARESSLSSSLSSERESLTTLTRALLEPRRPRRLSSSQPELTSARSQSQPCLKRRGSQLIKKDEDGCVVEAYVDGDGVQYKHTHLDLGERRGGGHVAAPRDVRAKRGDAVAGMEAVQVPRKVEEKKKKLGGFFSRLASFRFSNRKEDKKKKRPDDKSAEVPVQPPPRAAAKPDYIYIPLKAPPSQPPKEPSSKPPLPRAPPRVVGASVKRGGDNAHPGQQQPQDHRRRRTIDSGESCPRPMEPMGLIETDLDTEVTVITNATNVKTRSLLNLGAEPRLGRHHGEDGGQPAARPHKSMEFLLDKQNLKVVEPPENELQKGDRVMSEHQLRVQRSLQKLTVPEWYKANQVPQSGFLLKKASTPRWAGTSSKTTSLSSLGSGSPSPAVLSPSSGAQPFVRWSTSKLNSTASSPCASTRSSFNARQPNGALSPSSARSSFSGRQPYLGWRSQERLSRPRTPAERLAASILAQKESPEIQTSIKEVTSAIVHYVSGLRPEGSEEGRSRSSSPRGSQKLCWLESSFVGIRPPDSPQTPVSLTEGSPAPPTSLRLDLQTHNGESVHA